ncbi:hypothetical protein STEG23_002573 [Scotinomys teguina]
MPSDSPRKVNETSMEVVQETPTDLSIDKEQTAASAEWFVTFGALLPELSNVPHVLEKQYPSAAPHIVSTRQEGLLLLRLPVLVGFPSSYMKYREGCGSINRPGFWGSVTGTPCVWKGYRLVNLCLFYRYVDRFPQ